MTTLITLVGEQPVPVLLPIRALQPAQVLLVHTTGNRGTEAVARRVAQLIPESNPAFLPVDPYDIPKIRARLEESCREGSNLRFNLTGGTKPMILAAYALAAEHSAPFVYFQTEGPRGRDQRSLLYTYRWENSIPIPDGPAQELHNLITLDEYLRAYLDAYQAPDPHYQRQDLNEGARFERAVHDALWEVTDEIMGGIRPEGVKDQVEIDLLVRCQNQVAALEVKLGKGRNGESGKHAVDQLTTAAAREYLGTYTARFLITGVRMDERYKALARALRVRVVELPGYRDGRSLSGADLTNLRQAIHAQLGNKSL